MKPQADIQHKLKIALDETRMLIMGVQILIAFQLDAIVQDRFSEIPWSSKTLVGVALVLMVCTVGLLIAPAARHRLVDDGEATSSAVAAAGGLIKFALLALAIGIALDLYVAMERIAGFSVALAVAIAAFLAAVMLWYVFALVWRAPVKKETAVNEDSKATPLSTKIDYMLTEARVVLPGVQALLGFQLIAVFTRQFEQLPNVLKVAHAVALGMLALSMILLIALAAFHRLAFNGEDAPTVHRVGSILVTAAVGVLAVALTADVLVAIGALTGRIEVGVLAAVSVFLMLVGLWYVWPLALRRSLQRRST